MPVEVPRLGDARPWHGRDYRFATKDQHEALVSGQVFYIIDALDNFGPEQDVAFLIQPVEDCTEQNPIGHPAGDPFVWTRNASGSRVALVAEVRKVSHPLEGAQDSMGPCQIRLIKNRDAGRSDFYAINAYKPGENGDEIPFS